MGPPGASPVSCRLRRHFKALKQTIIFGLISDRFRIRHGIILKKRSFRVRNSLLPGYYHLHSRTQAIVETNGAQETTESSRRKAGKPEDAG
jgi:hypothetical protein